MTNGGLGNDAERASWQPEVGCVGDDHGDVVFSEPPPQLGGAPRVELDRGDMSATGDEGFGERAGARPDVEHEIVRAMGATAPKLKTASVARTARELKFENSDVVVEHHQLDILVGSLARSVAG